MTTPVLLSREMDRLKVRVRGTVYNSDMYCVIEQRDE